ncbi:helix-turn-helix domain-containing protein [Glycomyces sp. NPDC048151]|uniref:helix-turn-helix domain-containing protein n=1 Tax=Glycomyces sp. NPDC048151 TaxID=3364002 RepID=UPI0037243048
MPHPSKPLNPERGLPEWFGAELRHHRRRAGLSQDDLGQRVHFSGDLIGKIEKADRTCSLALAEDLDRVLETDGVLARAWRLVEAQADSHSAEPDRHPRSPIKASNIIESRGMLERDDRTASEKGLPVLRREILSVALNWGATVLLAPITPAVTALVDALGGGSLDETRRPVDLVNLSIRLVRVKNLMQASAFDHATGLLPALLRDLEATANHVHESENQHLRMLTADAHQVTATVLLKQGDPASAALAVNRSIDAAISSEDPLTIATAFRTASHTLLRTNRSTMATDLAASHAANLDPYPATPDRLSTQGSLLLKAAVAAATGDQRSAAESYLDAAADTADRLGVDGNYCWTGFGPTNVELHRLHVALELGDLDQATAEARRINADRIALPDRKARYAVDAAAAYAGTGRFEDALESLWLAESTAPQETRTIKSVPETMKTVHRSGSDRIRSDASALAERLEQPA